MNQKFASTTRYFFLSLIGLIILLPVLWMILSSFRVQSEIFHFSKLSWHYFIPVNWTLENYKEIFIDKSSPFGRYMLNTLFVALTVTVLGVFVNSLAAFAFAKMRFPFKRFLFFLFISTLAIPYEVLMIPQYLLMRDFDWVNTYKALIAPQIVWAFGIFLLFQFFKEIPRDTIEAAKIDGASWLKIYSKIVIPSSTTALLTLAIMTFVVQWDMFLWPLIVINDNSKQVVNTAIASYSAAHQTSWGNILAAASISSVPIIIVFLFLQKYYVRGVMSSGLKG